MSSRWRIACAPPRPVQSPGSTIVVPTTMPSDVVAPTRLPGLAQDVGDQAGRRGLAVRAADRDDRQPPIGVADPARARARSPRRRGPRPARPGAPAAAQLIGRAPAAPRARRARARTRRSPRPVAHRPRQDDDPVAGVGRSMDGRRGPVEPSGARAAAGGSSPRAIATRPGCSTAGTVAASRTRACGSGSRRPYQRAPPADRRPRPSPPARAGTGSDRRAGGSR